MHPVALQGPVANPRGPTDNTLAAGPTEALLPVKEFTEAAGPCTWANNATEPNKKPRTTIALFTGSSYSRTACRESLLVPARLDPQFPIRLPKIQSTTYFRTLRRGDYQIGDYCHSLYDLYMELRALLLSQDTEMIEVLRLALEDLGIDAEVHSTAPWAGEDIADHRFDAVIVDFDVPTTDEFLRGVRKSPGNNHALTFAIVNRETGLPAAFAMGANLALQKPVTVESARNSLRAAYGLIMQERRHYFRYPIETLVMISPDEHTSIVGTSTNVSEGGMSIKSDRELQLNGVVKLTFSLPGVKGEIDARALVMWKDPMGRAGIRFEKPSNATREKLLEWLQMQAATY